VRRYQTEGWAGLGWPIARHVRTTARPAPEFAYAQPWLPNPDRLAALDSWVHAYNTRRAHSALGGQPPITRLDS
jgi:transposase InsO family protein